MAGSPPLQACILRQSVQLPERNRLLKIALVALLCVLLAWLALPSLRDTNDKPAPRAKQDADLFLHPPSPVKQLGAPPQAAPLRDAGLDAHPFRGPFRQERFRASGPGKIRCGDQDCVAPNQLCCHVEHDKFCVETEDGCPDAGWDLACDETADCEAGLKCCGIAKPIRRRLARCVKSCSRPTWQLCAHDEECESKNCVLGSRCGRVTRGRLKLPAKR